MTTHYTDADPARGCGCALVLVALALFWVVILVVAAVIVSRIG
jgi:hypothetical protein